MQVNMHEAKSRLSQLVEAAEKGEEVILARNDKPVVRLVPVVPNRKFGCLRGVVAVPSDEQFRALISAEVDEMFGL